MDWQVLARVRLPANPSCNLQDAHAQFGSAWKTRSVVIGSRWRDYARHPSHTTGRAVFRIRRLNAAAFYMEAARSDGIRNP